MGLVKRPPGNTSIISSANRYSLFSKRGAAARTGDAVRRKNEKNTIAGRALVSLIFPEEIRVALRYPQADSHLSI
jgi:hypothetical protein